MQDVQIHKAFMAHEVKAEGLWVARDIDTMTRFCASKARKFGVTFREVETILRAVWKRWDTPTPYDD